MNRDKKTLALYAVFVIVALFSLYKVYSFLRSESLRNPKGSRIRAPESWRRLNEKQVGAIKIGDVGQKSFLLERKASATSTSTRTC